MYGCSPGRCRHCADLGALVLDDGYGGGALLDDRGTYPHAGIRQEAGCKRVVTRFGCGLIGKLFLTIDDVIFRSVPIHQYEEQVTAIIVEGHYPKGAIPIVVIEIIDFSLRRHRNPFPGGGAPVPVGERYLSVSSKGAQIHAHIECPIRDVHLSGRTVHRQNGSGLGYLTKRGLQVIVHVRYVLD